MSSPPNTNNNRQNNSQAQEYRRKGNPLGVLFGLLILGGACFGLYYLWKMKKNEINNIFPQANQPSQQASSLNITPDPDQTNKVQLNSPTTAPNNTITPNQYSNNTNTNTPAYNQLPFQPKASSTKSASRLKQKNIEAQTQNLIYQSKDGRKRVLNGYGGLNTNNNSVKAKSGQSSVYISPDKVLPARGFIQGSLQSLISDNNKSVANGLPRPNQLIYFATKFYIKEKALLFASNKLKALGFYRTHLSSDEYDQGRPIIVEGLDANNNQAFFFAKPNNNETLWKIEIYQANHIASK